MAEKLADGNEAIALLCNTLPTDAMHFRGSFQFGREPSDVAKGRPQSRHHTCLCCRADRRWLPRSRRCASHIRARAAQFGGTARTGFGQWLGEFIATFGLIATILGCVRFTPEAL